jgi:hypothetical protein
VFNTIGTGGAGKQNLLKVLAVADLAVEPSPDEPHPPAGGIGLKTKFAVGRTIEVFVITGEFAITAPEASMDNVCVFHSSPPSRYRRLTLSA